MPCFANQISGDIQHTKSRCHVLPAKLNVVVPPWGISYLEYSAQLVFVGPWAGFLHIPQTSSTAMRSKKTWREGKGLQRSVESIGMLQGWDPPSCTSPSSPSPQWWPPNRGGMPSSLLVMLALNLCCGVTISDHSLFFLPPCASLPFQQDSFPLHQQTWEWITKLFSWKNCQEMKQTVY